MRGSDGRWTESDREQQREREQESVLHSEGERLHAFLHTKGGPEKKRSLAIRGAKNVETAPSGEYAWDASV